MDILTVETLAETLQGLNRPLLTQGLRMLGQDPDVWTHFVT